TFATISLDDYVEDIETTDASIVWTFSGNTDLNVSIDDRVATIGIPDENWNGSETITFTATDDDASPLSASDDATFTVSASSICYDETFTAASGTITDNSGASDYQNNMACEKLIQPVDGGIIILTFMEFNTESGYDFVRVYDGATTSDPLLGTFSGSSLPPAVSSSNGSMLITFITDYSVTAAGWSATYTTEVVEGCVNETFTDASGTVTDNSGALNYQNDMSCEKLIQPTEGGIITLTFTEFSTESGYDFVRVYDGATTSDPLLGTFSSSSLPAAVTSTGGSMLITFITDYSVTAAGWSATYTTAASGCVNETFTAASGTITDNSGASDYQNNMSCEKLIQPADGGIITLTFTEFSTESGYDFVRVYDGATVSAPQLGTFSGSSLPPVLTSSGGNMLITFITDYSVAAAGWSAAYTTQPLSGCINETFTAASGTFTDNSGASNYQNNMSCEKLIQPAGGGIIALTFTEFSTESGYDFVRVYDGATTSAPLLGTFSGSSLPPVLTSSGGSMLITFTTDYSVTESGWSAAYYTTDVPEGCINETFTDASGTVTDNSGTSNYLNNMMCEKLIQPSGSSFIVLSFDEFDTEYGFDFVRVYDGATTSSRLLGTYSGISFPPTLTSSGGSMLITFTTDYSVTASGWSASYVALYDVEGSERIKSISIIDDENTPEQLNLYIYPNPTKGTLTVETNYTEEVTFTVDLIDVSGQIVMNQTIQVVGGKFDIDLSDNKRGFYILKVMTENAVQYIRLIKE
ncbi:MAG: T9SS type A sorting domain-containing protein, partial [Bacteroidales bacterium]|nr:T9SS type A sorting domain-containing protein [Bacteroidales bacterium]